MNLPAATPAYADFDDYRQNQRVVVVIRWFLLVIWLFVINYREAFNATLVVIDTMGAALVAMNALLTFRIIQKKPVSSRIAVALSVMDLTVITTGIAITNQIENRYFLMYYPALMGLSLTYPRPIVAFGFGSLAIVAYAIISTVVGQGTSFDVRGERLLIMRVTVMYAIIAGCVLMASNELRKRRAAVAAVEEQSARNLELQRRTMQAELAAQAERQRLAREIHDGVAQSVYALVLNLEAASETAAKENSAVSPQLEKLVPLARQTLLETRHYIFDLKPLLSAMPDIAGIARSQVKEFSSVSGLPVDLQVSGQPETSSPETGAAFYRILRECLANVYKHASATRVGVVLTFEDGRVSVTVRDDGVGFDSAMSDGYGLRGISERVLELGGSFTISSSPGKGATVTAGLPLKGVKLGLSS